MEYFSGREPGGGCRFTVGRGRPLDIAGSTATASPVLPPETRRVKDSAHEPKTSPPQLTKFLPEALWAEMIEGVVSDLSGRHRRFSKIESWPEPSPGIGCGDDVGQLDMDSLLTNQSQA